jgi:hypothetical protein
MARFTQGSALLPSAALGYVPRPRWGRAGLRPGGLTLGYYQIVYGTSVRLATLARERGIVVWGALAQGGGRCAVLPWATAAAPRGARKVPRCAREGKRKNGTGYPRRRPLGGLALGYCRRAPRGAQSAALRAGEGERKNGAG